MGDTIVFRIDAGNKKSYASLANFIYKRENHMDFSPKEMHQVTYKYYLRTPEMPFQQWACRISMDRTTFESVNQPDRIKNITDKYQIIYCVRVSEDSDVAELHNLFLIKHFYAGLHILILFEDYKRGNYHKISQFLYQINKRDADFYDSCFFVNEGKVQRAQLKEIKLSRSFIPLQIVDKENLMRLFGECKEVLSQKYLRGILKHRVKTADLGEKGDIIEGGLKLLGDARKRLSEIPDEQLIRIFLDMDVFSFNLLCYVISVKQEVIFDALLLENYAFQMRQYSTAIRQLAENIVFHSKTGFGVIAVRLYKKDSRYAEKQFYVNSGEERSNFLEIIVSDFCGDDQSEDIAENFIANLEDEEVKKAFAGLRPASFFEHDSDREISSAWTFFYENPENIGKHFGLRIFQSVVSTFKGSFGAESHSGYISQPGDSFFSHGDKEPEGCIPGTRYQIVMPLEIIQKVIRKQDLSLDSGINVGKFVNTVLNYHISDMDLDWNFPAYLSQEDKNRQIKNWSKSIYSNLKKKDCDIVYTSLERTEDSKGETLAKALVMALSRLERDTSVVFYQCSDQLKKSIFETLKIFYQSTDIEGMFFDRKILIVFYSKNFEELIIDLSSTYNTNNINTYIAHMKCITSTEWYLDQNAGTNDLNKGADSYMPYDILHEVEIDKEKRTLFEHYTAVILNQSIQTPDFGCKLEHTHMRLGSTIHIDKFYEAEILFDNKLFVSRFAMLLVKDMKEDLKDIRKLTLYGYGTYSETVLVQMIDMINNLYPKRIDVDYIILEREEEKRGLLHKDRIRYNRLFQSEEERTEYFKDRKVVTIVLINSTLKTHLRLISLFKEENKKEVQDDEWLLCNYAVLLVGNAEENRYWILEDKKVKLINGEIHPTPRYFVHAHANYQEPSECEYCFPENPLAEIPLIEVNAASTIPNQAFGIIKRDSINTLNLNYQKIRTEEEQLECLKDKFIYRHTQRNENHFLYYFRTENIWVCEKDRIRNSLQSWKRQWKREERLQYNIIVAPMHFSNAGFVESVNQEVFGGNAILLRIDFDKEYRCNAYAKFSYLRNYVEQLYRKDKKGSICVHFVDDAIISGRTYHRAKSLVESVLGIDQDLYKIEIKVFDKVFVIVDRNSMQSRRQYVRNCKTDFYAFIHIHISSLRNYGDSCIFCNLRNEAELLYKTASTKQIAEYWMHCIQKFKLYQLEECDGQPQKNADRAFRRLFCTHMAQSVLEERYHGNDKVQTIYLILKLLRADYEGREKDRYEYFLSYLKCISRPFLVFKRAVKEAIFDILLLFIETVVQKKDLRSVIRSVEDKKEYLGDRRLILLFNWLDRNILNHTELTDENKQDLVRLLMKQLTELKSNYIIRPDRMEALFLFMNELKANKREFENYYMRLIDRLVGSSSDTNKSIWLDKQILDSEFRYAEEDYRAWVILENTKAFRDGIEKLYIMASEKFRCISEKRIDDLKERYDYHRVNVMFEDFIEKNSSELQEYKETKNLEGENIREIQKRIQRFIEKLPELETINFLESAYSLKAENTNWGEIFYRERGILKDEIEVLKNSEHVNREQLKKLINQECDSYQYGNFYKILYQDGYMDGQEISSDGADMLACCMKVLKLCRESKAEVLAKVQELAALFKIILRADRVQFIIESEENAHLDDWKTQIEKKYNDIVGKHRGEEELPLIHIRGKKHYTVIVEEADYEDYNTDMSQEVESLLYNMAGRKDRFCNYIVSKERGIVIWELENSQRSIWISIENRDWRERQSGQKLKIARDMRRVMVFYQELKNKIFNPENDDFLNEISRVRKELRIYNSNKIYTHTKDYQQEMQFQQAARHFMKGDGQEQYLENYPSYVLNLLADINVSKYYHDGLRKTVYEYGKKIEHPAVWRQFSTLLRDKQEFVYRETEEEKVVVKLETAGIDENDAVLCQDSSRSVQELTLLIYSLIMNAAEKGRGWRQTQKNTKNMGVQLEEKCVIVKLYKEEGCLVIENMCEEPVQPEEIEWNQDHVPESEEDGISFWSFNFYIKQCINSLILEKIKTIEEDIRKGKTEAERIRYLGRWIEKLAGREYEIRPAGYGERGQNYFKVILPIFMEKYQCDSCCEVERGGSE